MLSDFELIICLPNPISPERKFRTFPPCRRLFSADGTDGLGRSFNASLSLHISGGNTGNLSLFAKMAANGAGIGQQPLPHLDTASTSNGNGCNFGPSVPTGILSIIITHSTIFVENCPSIFIGQRRKSITNIFAEDLGFLNDSIIANNFSGPAYAYNNIENTMSPQNRPIRKPDLSKPHSLRELENDFPSDINQSLDAMPCDLLISSDPIAIVSHPSSAIDLASSPVNGKSANESTNKTHTPLFQLRPARFVNQLFPASPRNKHQNSVTIATTAPNHIMKMRPCSVKKHAAPGNALHSPGSVLSKRRSSSPELFQSARTLQPTDNGLVHQLPCFDSLKDAIKRINPETLVDLMNGSYDQLFDRLLIFDCRYPYEFEGGHIPSAINVNTPEAIESLLLSELPQASHAILVFHCEFSSERAPRMALHFRNLDRQLNKAAYPLLHYPEMYILDGGYKSFWEQYGERCDPAYAYRPMRNPQFRDELRLHQRARHAFKSACHISQHSHSLNKTRPVASGRISLSQPTAASRVVDNTRRFFQQYLTGSASDISDCGADQAHISLAPLSRPCSLTQSRIHHDIPPYSIPQAKSLSSILPSELDYPSEADIADDLCDNSCQ